MYLPVTKVPGGSRNKAKALGLYHLQPPDLGTIPNLFDPPSVVVICLPQDPFQYIHLLNLFPSYAVVRQETDRKVTFLCMLDVSFYLLYFSVCSSHNFCLLIYTLPVISQRLVMLVGDIALTISPDI